MSHLPSLSQPGCWSWDTFSFTWSWNNHSLNLPTLASLGRQLDFPAFRNPSFVQEELISVLTRPLLQPTQRDFTLIFQGEWVQHCLLYQVHLFSLRKRISWYKTSREKSDPLSNSFLRIKDNFSSSSWFYTLPSSAVAAAKSLQSCPTLCDPIDGSPPGAPFPGILQARILEWVAISFCSAWKWKWSRSIMSDS